MTRQLYRSRKQRIIAGIAGGLAEYFETDVSLIRLLWILGIFIGGGGLIAYFIVWMVIPEAVPDDPPGSTSSLNRDESVPSQPLKPEKARHRQNIAGLALISVGLLVLLNRFIPEHFSKYIWPLVLIGFGIVLLRSRH